MNKLKKIAGKNETYILLIILLLSMVIQGISGMFFASNNILDLIRSIIVNAIYALCALLAFISTGPDVSFPMIGALASYLTFAAGNKFDLPVIILIPIALIIGAMCGSVNGFFVVKYRFRSLIVTLATSTMCYGIIFGAFGGSRSAVPKSLSSLAGWKLFTVTSVRTGLSSVLPGMFLVMVALYLIVYLVLNFTTVGRGIYAIGGDEVAAKRAGYNVNAIRFGIFVANGMIAAIGGLAYALMSNNCTPTEYYGGEMIVIAAIVLGGVRLTGGVGSLTGCILGTLLLSMVTSSLTMVGISVYWQQTFVGVIIIIGAAISSLQAVRAQKIFVQARKGD